MSEVKYWTTWSRGERQTILLGMILGRLLRPGSIVALHGELGSGKTRLTQGIAEGLEVAPSEIVSSPSFALIHEYQGRIPLYHMDFFRLQPNIWEPDLGIEEYLWGDGACVIEWVERMEAILPPDHLGIDLKILGPRKRQIDLRAEGERHRQILEALQREFSGKGTAKAGG